MIVSDTPPFYTRYGFARTGRAEAPLEILPYDEICRAGALRATIVASAIDLVGGLHTRALAGRDATFTSDLSLRIPDPGRPTRLLARGSDLRAGRRLVTTAVTLTCDDAVYAYGETTFARIARAPGDAPDVATLSTPEEIRSQPLERMLDAEVGVLVVDAAKGQVEVPLRPALLNPEGVMQGALVALVVECAALARAEVELAGAQVVCELDLRYLAAAAVGPVAAHAEWIGQPSARLLRVALYDRGKSDRLTTSALVRVANAPT